MGSIFDNGIIPAERARSQKHEESLQKQVCHYLRLRFPNLIFRSDYAGSNLSRTRAGIMKSLQSGKGFPDLFIYKPMIVEGKQYAGLALELKKEGTTIILKTGPRKGQIVADDHIREQYTMLTALNAAGYFADFGIGYDDCIKKINWYMGIPEDSNPF